MEIITRQAREAVVVRELSDENGLYLLESKIAGEKEGETVQYEYIRKGRFPDGNQSSGSVIHIVFYVGEVPVGGHDVANFNSETGEWVESV